MAEVKCTALIAVPLPSGRLLPPGRKATGVDPSDPEVAPYIANGSLIVTDDSSIADVPQKVDDVLSWVGDRADRARLALEAEQQRPESDRRKTLTDKLAPIVATDQETT